MRKRTSFTFREVFYHARGTETDYRKAIDFYQNATQLDPRYALAWSNLSITWLNLSRKFLNGDQAQHAYAQARSAAESALALDPNLAAAHTARGFVLESADFNGRERKPNTVARLNWRRTMMDLRQHWLTY